jgi:hypothetical protein
LEEVELVLLTQQELLHFQLMDVLHLFHLYVLLHQVVEVEENQLAFLLQQMEHLVLQVEVQEMLVLDQQGEQVLLALKVMVVEEQDHLSLVPVVVEALVVMVLMAQHLMVELVE